MAMHLSPKTESFLKLRSNGICVVYVKMFPNFDHYAAASSLGYMASLEAINCSS